MQQFDPNGSYVYVGRNVQIGTGFGGMQPVAQKGTVAITADGVVALFDGKDALIDQAPIASAMTKKIPLVGAQTVFLFLGDKRYSVSVNSVAGQIASGNLYPGALGVFQSRASTAEFVRSLDEVKASQPQA
jgi:hypothetical protein